MTRVDETLFEGEHYLGRPADHTDKIITRRAELVKEIPDFCDKNLRLLEIGCGNGATLLLMSGEMRECIGVDIYEGHKKVFEESMKSMLGEFTRRLNSAIDTTKLRKESSIKEEKK